MGEAKRYEACAKKIRSDLLWAAPELWEWKIEERIKEFYPEPVANPLKAELVEALTRLEDEACDFMAQPDNKDYLAALWEAVHKARAALARAHEGEKHAT